MTQGPTVIPPSSESSPPTRLCGRCRKSFDGDATIPAGPLLEWWVCDDCRQVLLPGRVASAAALARAGEAE